MAVQIVMPKIKGWSGMTAERLAFNIKQGARFVQFEYCISLILITFKRRSAIYFLKPGENALVKSAPYTLISFLFGWWGFPWGLLYTPVAILINFKGGVNRTGEIAALVGINEELKNPRKKGGMD